MLVGCLFLFPSTEVAEGAWVHWGSRMCETGVKTDCVWQSLLINSNLISHNDLRIEYKRIMWNSLCVCVCVCESSVWSVWKKISYLLFLPHSSSNHEVPDSLFVSPPTVCGLRLPALRWSGFQFKPRCAMCSAISMWMCVCVCSGEVPPRPPPTVLYQLFLMCVATVRGPVVYCPSDNSWFSPFLLIFFLTFFPCFCFWPCFSSFIRRRYWTSHSWFSWFRTRGVEEEESHWWEERFPPGSSANSNSSLFKQCLLKILIASRHRNAGHDPQNKQQ